jgi:hypothetical protein
MGPEPGQSALGKRECRDNRVGIKDDAMAHGCSRAHRTASSISCSVMPSRSSFS